MIQFFKRSAMQRRHSSGNCKLTACRRDIGPALAAFHCILFANVLVAAEPTSQVSFRHDVMAVLSKAGCNAGTCHGNVNGKGGFYLSLRGQDPDFDYLQLVHSVGGRRIDRIKPSQSLILQKAIGKISHQGGKRFENSSLEFNILSSWISQGLRRTAPDEPQVTEIVVSPEESVLWDPEHSVSLTVNAIFDDGRKVDVTRLAVFEPDDPTVAVSSDGAVEFSQFGLATVLVRYLDSQKSVKVAYRPAVSQFRTTAGAATSFIDDVITERLNQLRITPAPPASDSTYVRRLYLDLAGRLPSASEARTFVSDNRTDKRIRLIDRLLASPEFAEMWALKWSDLVRNEEKTLDARGVETLHQWMIESFAEDKPISRFASELITATGSTYKNPPANYWRAHRDPFVRSETTAQVFLGVRLQCAKCHNHPFDIWSQDQYYQWSSLFAGIDYEIVENKRRDDLDKHEFVGEQIVQVKDEGLVTNPRNGKKEEARFLGSSDKIEKDRLQQLAEWMTGDDNEMFAQVQTNRVWFHLMGRGLVEPIDDIRATNPASHPELLKKLSIEFVESGYSVKHLVRVIVSSQAYQADSQFSEGRDPEAYDERLYARGVVKRLTAEQILDAQSQILGLPARFEGYPAGTKALQVAGTQRVRGKFEDGDMFLRQFGKPERLLSCECERSDQPTLGQALTLVGGEDLQQRLDHPNNRIGTLLKENDDLQRVVDELVWTALSRPATQAELDKVTMLVKESGNQRVVLEDFTWALLNAKELLFRN